MIVLYSVLKSLFNGSALDWPLMQHRTIATAPFTDSRMAMLHFYRVFVNNVHIRYESRNHKVIRPKRCNTYFYLINELFNIVRTLFFTTSILLNLSFRLDNEPSEPSYNSTEIVLLTEAWYTPLNLLLLIGAIRSEMSSNGIQPSHYWKA